MGLDMYLYGATWKMDGETSTSVIKLEEVAYWRKQNAIHNWFVKNVQNDVDNCAMYGLTDEYLLDLSMACHKVLANPTVENAMTVLPTRAGPFFGGTDLTSDFELEYYLDGLKYTVKMLSELFKKGRYEFYYYHASW